VIAETHGCGLVAAFVPALAPLRTMIRLAPALRPVLVGAMLARRMLTRPVFAGLVLPRRPRCIREINQVQLDKPPWSSVRQLPRWRWSRTVSARLDHKHRMSRR